MKTPPEIVVLIACPECGGSIRRRRRRDDGSRFLGCATFPSCRWTAPVSAEADAFAERLAELGRPITRREIRSILAWAHPDKNPSGTVSAHELCVRLTSLLDNAHEASA